jgi:U4/U6 small nuclear ribonucleoprotein PRP31
MPHIGVLFHCDLIQRLPPYLRRKALKNVAGKVALLARVDSYQKNNGIQEGDRFRAELEAKFQKWQEPDVARTKKALPIPEEKKRSKRGGRRVCT